MIFDTFAWIEYFEATTAGRRVKQILDDTSVVFTCPIILSELTSKTLRRYGPRRTTEYLDFILANCVVIEHTAEIGIAAGEIHAAMKEESKDFGMADAFVLASARARGVKVLTGDPHFKGLDDAVLL